MKKYPVIQPFSQPYLHLHRSLHSSLSLQCLGDLQGQLIHSWFRIVLALLHMNIYNPSQSFGLFWLTKTMDTAFLQSPSTFHYPSTFCYPSTYCYQQLSKICYHSSFERLQAQKQPAITENPQLYTRNCGWLGGGPAMQCHISAMVLAITLHIRRVQEHCNVPKIWNFKNLQWSLLL